MAATGQSVRAGPDLAPSRERVRALREGRVVVPDDVAIFRVAGPGALECLQGLLTNDLVQPGEGSLVYGALLTPKGMIVVDYWVIRGGGADGFLLVADRQGREPSLELFRKQLPPRLARVTDLSDEWSVLWLLGGPEGRSLSVAGLSPVLLEPGRASAMPGEAQRLWVAAGPPPAPFQLLLAGPRAHLSGVAEALRAGLARGAKLGDRDQLLAARVLAGWPTLGAEIDARTLPQEVRYDEIGGVSYTKGCYVGQETVARVHFRGHPNRCLRGLVIEGADPLAEGRLERHGKEVGTARTALALGDRTLALAPVRREVAPGDEVTIGGRRARVEALPFATALLE